jgi:L-methionine (R)-S-oxide reductase
VQAPPAGTPAPGGAPGAGGTSAPPEARHYSRALVDPDALRRAAGALLAGGADDHDAALRRILELLPRHHPTWNWVGIYLLCGDTLVLGPFIGAPTEHTRIPVGRGVCGTAVARDTNLVVDDVTKLDNYLACSVGTRSELVVLIRHDGRVVGQFDIDSDEPAAFSSDDEALLESLAPLVAPRCAALAATLGPPGDGSDG